MAAGDRPFGAGPLPYFPPSLGPQITTHFTTIVDEAEAERSSVTNGSAECCGTTIAMPLSILTIRGRHQSRSPAKTTPSEGRVTGNLNRGMLRSVYLRKH